MSFTLFSSVIFLACVLTPSAAQNSCKGRCGAEYYRGYMCQCDYGCMAYGECCSDFESRCTTKNSCKGRCGENFKRGRLCTCDSDCVKYKQCCPDFKSHCDAEAEVSGASGVTAPVTDKSCNNVNANNPKEEMPADATEMPYFEGNSAEDNLIPLVNPTSYPQDDLSDEMYGQIFPSSELMDPEPSPIPESTSGYGTPSEDLLDPVSPEATVNINSQESNPELVTVFTQMTPSDTEPTQADASSASVPMATEAAGTIDATPPVSSQNPSASDRTEPTPSDNPDVTTLSPDNPDVTTLSPDNPDVTTLSPDNPDVTTLPSDNPDVTTLSPDNPDVTTLSPDTLDVTTLSPDNPDVTTLPSDNPDVTTLSPDNPDVTTLPSDNPDVTTLSPDNPDVTTLPSDNPDVTTLPSDNPDVTSSVSEAAAETSSKPPLTDAPLGVTSVDAAPTETTTAPLKVTPAQTKPKPSKPTSKPEEKPLDTGASVNIDNPRDYQADDSNDTNLCSGRPVGAVTTLRNGTIVVFRGHYFWFLDRNRVPGPALGITQVWGVPSPIDTAFTRCNCQGKTYIFKGPQYWRFDNDVLDPGYPKVIERGFDGLRGHITAALSVPQYRKRRESVYFFKRGGLVQKYSYQFGTSPSCARRTHQAVYTVRSRQTRQAVSYLERPVNIRTAWRGFPSTITAAVSVPSNSQPEGYKYYVFSRTKSYRVQMDGARPALANTKPNTTPQSRDFIKCPKKV